MLPTKESKGRMLGRYSVRPSLPPSPPWESTQSNKNELKLPLTRWSLVRWGFCIHAGVGFVCLCVCKCTKGNFHYALNYTPLVVMEFEIIPPPTLWAEREKKGGGNFSLPDLSPTSLWFATVGANCALLRSAAKGKLDYRSGSIMMIGGFSAWWDDNDARL